PPAPRRPVYGYLHMAKVAGTNLNGELTMRFERVCGNKGYSYDAIRHNVAVGRNESKAAKLFLPNDIYSAMFSKYNRGRVPDIATVEIGYQNCDYISEELKYKRWLELAELFGRYGKPLELHVPCREPIDHLMSLCNYFQQKFKCSLTGHSLKHEVEKFLAYSNRFSPVLQNVTNLSLKCFDNDVTFSKYIPYISPKLQPRKITTKYVSRETNAPRQKDKECIWREENKAVREKVKSILLKASPYHSYCDACIGSRDDLFYKN
ncbi:unnamed protein product, partial [Ectocarpus fasciculatus]